jgi:NarL family two-component system response regulator LiaR
MIRILLADDHPIVRDGLVAVLGTQEDFAVVGEAASGDELLDRALALRPDVVLTDLEMPGMDGGAAIRALRQALPDTPVVVLTAFDTDNRIVGALEAGARGDLLKGAPRAEIFRAIRVVAAGGSLLEPLVASHLIRRISGDRPAHEALTAREAEVLQMLAQGQPNKQIARDLGITERTVKFHVSAILAKLGVANRTEAIARAAQRGIIDLKSET